MACWTLSAGIFYCNNFHREHCYHNQIKFIIVETCLIVNKCGFINIINIVLLIGNEWASLLDIAWHPRTCSHKASIVEFAVHIICFCSEAPAPMPLPIMSSEYVHYIIHCVGWKNRREYKIIVPKLGQLDSSGRCRVDTQQCQQQSANCSRRDICEIPFLWKEWVEHHKYCREPWITEA